MGKHMMVGLWAVTMSLVVLAATSSLENDITCAEGITKLIPCMQFFKGSGPPAPSVDCCLGAGDVFRQANTTAIRRDLCKCFKNAAARFGVLPERANLIPQLCHIPVSFPIDPKVDCNAISV